MDLLGGVLVSMLISSVVDHGFDPWSGKTKDCQIGICCFSAKHAALRRKSKDWLAWNQDNVSRVGASCLLVDCCVSELALNPSERVDLVQSRPHYHLIEN